MACLYKGLSSHRFLSSSGSSTGGRGVGKGPFRGTSASVRTEKDFTPAVGRSRPQVETDRSSSLVLLLGQPLSVHPPGVEGGTGH